MKKLFSLALVSVATFLLSTMALAPLASAAEFISSPDEGGNVTLSSTDTHHNAYVAGSSVFINSTTTGDLYAVGGSITVEGSVEQDVVIAGGNVTINGTVGGDVRVLSGTVIINNKIAGDLVMAGGTVTMTEKGTIGADAFIAGGQIVFDGAVGGNMQVSAGQVTINNAVGGNVKIMADQSLTFGSKAVVPGKITYKGVKEAIVQDGAQVSTIDFQTVPRSNGNAGNALLAVITVATLLKILSIIVFGLVIMKLYPRTTNDLVQHMNKKPWHNLGIGFIGLVVVPFAALILLVTLVGAYVAITALLIWMLLFILASLVVCFYTGAWLLKVLGKSTELVVNWHALVLGSVVIVVISFVPFIGMLIFFILALMAFGSILSHAHGHVKSEQTSSTATPTIV